MLSVWSWCFLVCLWGWSLCVHIVFLCLTLSLWFPVWSTSWQTPTCHIYCPAAPSHPDLHQQTHLGKPSENQSLTVEKQCDTQMSLVDRKIMLCVSVYLNRLIYLMCSHGGRHGDSDGWWHSELSCSSSRLCLAVQWQRQEVRGSNRMDTFSRERAGAAEHSPKLPTWHTWNRGITAVINPIIQKHTHLGSWCP